MRWGSWSGLVFLVCCVGLAPSVWAADAEEPPYDRTGFYIGIGGSYGIDMALEDSLSFLTNDPEIGSIKVKGSGGVDSHFGYRFVKWAAAEIQLEYLPSFNVQARAEGTLPDEDISKVEQLAFGGNLKLIPFPMKKIEPFGLIGVAGQWVRADGDFGTSDWESAVALRGGGGFDIHIVEQVVVSLSATYVKPFGDLEDEFDYLSVGFGIQYHFR